MAIGPKVMLSYPDQEDSIMTTVRQGHAARLFAGLAVLAAVCTPAAGAQGETAKEQGGTWRPLFDGKTLAGWHQVGDGQWVVEDGAVVGRTQEAAKLYGLLVSDGVYHDFTVRLKFKSVKGNSGFYIRTVLEAPDKAHGLQIEVDPRNNAGGVYESYGRAWVARPEPANFAKYFKPDDWNELTIAAYGGDVKVTVNGVTSAELKGDPSRPAGQLAMQMHAGNEMLVMFKDIEILGEPKKGEDKKGPTEPKRIEAGKDGLLVLPAKHARVTGQSLAYMPEWQAFGFWRAGDHAEWEVDVPRAGTYEVVMEWSVDDRNAGNPFVLEAGSQRLEGNVPTTGRWDVYRRLKIGDIRLEAGPQTLAFKPNGQFKTALMDLRELRLTPRPAGGKSEPR